MKDRLLIIYKNGTVNLMKMALKVAEILVYKDIEPETTILITDDIVTEQFIKENFFNVVILVNSDFECNFYELNRIKRIDIKM